jgi:hypothetical protein
VLRVRVQNPEVPARLPRSVRLDRGCSRSLPAVLPLVQPRTPSRRHRPDGPGRRARRQRSVDERITSCHARCRLRHSSHPLQGQRTQAPGAAHRRLDQSAEKGDDTTLDRARLLADLMTSGVSNPSTRSGRAMCRIRQRVRELTPRSRCHADLRMVIAELMARQSHLERAGDYRPSSVIFLPDPRLTGNRPAPGATGTTAHPRNVAADRQDPGESRTGMRFGIAVIHRMIENRADALAEPVRGLHLSGRRDAAHDCRRINCRQTMICQTLSGAPDTPRQDWRNGWDYSAHPEPRPCGAAAARRSKSLPAIVSNQPVRPHTLLR